jgi:alpha-tubulin suppressor-like RCC1 family protein
MNTWVINIWLIFVVVFGCFDHWWKSDYDFMWCLSFVALKESGSVFSWGRNNINSLNLYLNILLDFSSKITSSGREPKLIYIRNKIKQSVNFVKISCGQKHSLLLSKERDIYEFGNNKYLQLTNNLITGRIKLKLKKNLLISWHILKKIFRSHFQIEESPFVWRMSLKKYKSPS